MPVVRPRPRSRACQLVHLLQQFIFQTAALVIPLLTFTYGCLLALQPHMLSVRQLLFIGGFVLGAQAFVALCLSFAH